MRIYLFFNQSIVKNTEIKYNLSIDYTKLYQLLHKGIKVVGFGCFTGIDNKVNMEYSRLIEMVYLPEHKKYNFCTITFWQDQVVDEIGFAQICKSTRKGKCSARLLRSGKQHYHLQPLPYQYVFARH